jgi:chromosome segregation ATPase
MNDAVSLQERIQALQAEQARLEREQAERERLQRIADASARLRQARAELVRIADEAAPIETETTYAWQKLAELLSRLRSLRREHDRISAEAASAEHALRALGASVPPFASQPPRLPAPEALMRWALAVDVAIIQRWAADWRARRYAGEGDDDGQGPDVPPGAQGD